MQVFGSSDSDDSSFDSSDSFSSLFEAARQQSEVLEDLPRLQGGPEVLHDAIPDADDERSEQHLLERTVSYGMADDSNYSLTNLSVADDASLLDASSTPAGSRRTFQMFKARTEAKKAAAAQERTSKEAKQMDEGIQRFYDGDYQVTTLTGELWVADLLMVIFLFLPAHLKTLCSAGSVCRGWSERVTQVPQWRFVPRPSTIKLSPKEVTRWLGKQSKATLTKTSRGQVLDRHSFLDSVKFKVVLLEQQRRRESHERRKYVGTRLCLTPLYMLFWLVPLVAVLAMAYGFASLHTTGLTDEGQVGAASLLVGIVAGVFILLFLGYFVECYYRTPKGRALRRTRASRIMKEGWASLGIASMLLCIVGTVVVSLMQFRVSYLQGISQVPILDVTSCNFKPPVSNDLPYQVLPFTYRLGGTGAPRASGNNSFLGYTYNYSQPVLRFNGTSFTLLRSEHYSPSSIQQSNESPHLSNCQSSCNCAIAVLGTLQPEGWWRNVTSETSTTSQLSISQDAAGGVLFRSFRGGKFVATPSTGGINPDSVITTSQVLWNKYRVPMISPKPATKLQLPQVQVPKWKKAFEVTLIILTGIFLLASTVFTCRTKGSMEGCIVFWTVISLLCCNVVMLAVWGAVCYWSPKQEGLMPDYCMMSESSAYSMFITGTVLFGMGILKLLEERCKD